MDEKNDSKLKTGTASPAEPNRREFLESVGSIAKYVAPVVVVLAANRNAIASSGGGYQPPQGGGEE
jgi:hypothetical protein